MFDVSPFWSGGALLMVSSICRCPVSTGSSLARYYLVVRGF